MQCIRTGHQDCLTFAGFEVSKFAGKEHDCVIVEGDTKQSIHLLHTADSQAGLAHSSHCTGEEGPQSFLVTHSGH